MTYSDRRFSASNKLMMSAHITLTDLSSVGEARRTGLRMAETLGLDEVAQGELAIMITEAARNAIIHGGGGQALIAGIPDGASGKRIDLVVLDKGPGIKDMSRALQDGYSTAGTPGTGLGAIRRMAGVFDLFSNAQGTALLAQVNGAASSLPARNTLEIAGLAAPIHGETACGDRIAWVETPGRTVIMVVDGLGHGTEAAKAAEEAAQIFEAHSTEAPGAILARIHDALKKTRGGAAAIAELRPLAGTLTYAGIGNISGVIISNTGSRNLISHNGTLGHIVTRIQEFKVEWPADGILIMYSDGLQTRWDLSSYPGLVTRNPAIIAGVLLRDFRRRHDDSSVMVVRGRRQ